MKYFTFFLFFFFASLISCSPHLFDTFKSNEKFHRISDHSMHSKVPFHSSHSSDMYRQSKINEDELNSKFWLDQAKSIVEEHLKKTPNTKKAKNLIMFLGDGMSHPSIAAARVQIGNEDKKLYFEHFPYTANSKTYCVDKQVSDSACTATAYLCGVKAHDATIGLNAKATRSSCTDGADTSKHTESIASWAMKAGKDGGFVTTTRVTHASPTGIYGHITDRDWEGNVAVETDGCDSNIVDDIAEQLVHGQVGKKLKVAMGGGSMNFIDQKFSEHGAGNRTDGKHLIEEWMAMDAARTYVNNRQSLMDLDPANVKQVLGLFAANHISYNLDVQRDNQQQTMPSLTDLTIKAIDILSENENGYFLFVEGGRIDHGHHKNEARYAIDETVEFSKAIEAAMEKIDIEDTLVVVTADHGHVMTLAGYAPRGNDIFGTSATGDDGIPFMTLSYANGLGYYVHTKPEGGRRDPTTIDTTPVGFRFPTTLPVNSESHGGEDVGIWAVGPWAHLFQGTMEQHVIPHIMAYAACIGNGLKMCDNQ